MPGELVTARRCRAGGRPDPWIQVDPPLNPGPFSQDQRDDASGIFLPTFVIMVLWHKKGDN